MDHRTIRNNRDFATIAQNFTLANLEQLRFAIDRNPDPVAARITHRCWTSVLDHRKHHVAHLAFVLRRHYDDVGHAAKVSDVEQAVMSLAITAGNPAAIETK